MTNPETPLSKKITSINLKGRSPDYCKGFMEAISLKSAEMNDKIKRLKEEDLRQTLKEVMEEINKIRYGYESDEGTFDEISTEVLKNIDKFKQLLLTKFGQDLMPENQSQDEQAIPKALKSKSNKRDSSLGSPSGENEICEWECAYCGSPIRSSKRPTRCSCRNGYVKHIKKFQPRKVNGEEEK